MSRGRVVGGMLFRCREWYVGRVVIESFFL